MESIPTTLADVREGEGTGGFAEGSDDSGDYLTYKEETFERQSVFGVLLRLALSMAAVIGLIYGTTYVLRHFARRGTQKSANERLVQVVDKASLDGKRSVYLVKVIDRLMILGVGNENVTMLGSIRDESVVESTKSNDFSFHLRDLFSRIHSR
jgi:flagellar biosynthetic protein FliO